MNKLLSNEWCAVNEAEYSSISLELKKKKIVFGPSYNMQSYLLPKGVS